MSVEAAELSCKEAARLMSYRRDRALSKDEEEQLANHLLICRSCRNFDEQLGILSRVAARYGSDGSPPEDV